MKALVLSGGSGTRLQPLTHTTAKQLIPVANKPVLFYALEDISRAGIEDVGIIVGHTKKEIMEAVGDGSRWGFRLTYIEQDAPRGLAHAVLTAEKFLGKDDFVMYLGDNILRSGIAGLIESFKKSKSDATIALSRVRDPQRFGVAELRDGKVVGLEEKPKKPKSDLALIGIYIFSKSILDAAKKIKPSWRNELEITDAIQVLIDSGKKIDSHVVEGWWKDTGKPEDLLEANRLVLEEMEGSVAGTLGPEARASGNVIVGKNSVVEGSSILEGPLIIGEDCRIVDAKIGKYTAIGDGTEIAGAEISDSVLVGHSKIACGAKIAGSLIGKNVTITGSKSGEPHRLVLGENSQVSL